MTTHEQGQKDASDGEYKRNIWHCDPEYDTKAQYDKGYYSTKAQIDQANGDYNPPSYTLFFSDKNTAENRETYAEAWEAARRNS